VKLIIILIWNKQPWLIVSCSLRIQLPGPTTGELEFLSRFTLLQPDVARLTRWYRPYVVWNIRKRPLPGSTSQHRGATANSMEQRKLFYLTPTKTGYNAVCLFEI